MVSEDFQILTYSLKTLNKQFCVQGLVRYLICSQCVNMIWSQSQKNYHMNDENKCRLSRQVHN